MFGKTGVFCDGVMFGMVAEDTLYLRVDDHNRATFKEAESFRALSYEKKGSTYRPLLLASTGATPRRTR
jgi:DNA transformation protein